MQIAPGFTLGHEFVGTVLAAGEDVTRVGEGDRVLGCYCSACGECFFCRRGDFHKCDKGRVFGHGEVLGDLQGAQADQVLVPNADLTLRKVPEGMTSDAALFAGDVMGTGYHAVHEAGLEQGAPLAVLGLGPVGLCAVQAATALGAGPGDRRRHGRRSPGDGEVLRRDAAPPDRRRRPRRGRRRSPRAGAPT